MPCERPRRAFLGRGALATVGVLAGCTDVISGPSSETQLREHEEELRRFEDLTVALDEGYRTTGLYVRTDEGVLGEVFVNRMVDELQPTTPQALLYGLTEAGQYRPFGLKWFVSAEEYDDPPTLFGKQFSGPMEGASERIPTHYALHAWLFRENPDGLFATYNPAVEPPKLVDRIEPVRDALRRYVGGVVAEEEAGYRNTEKCIATEDGGYGVPFVKTDGDAGGTDPTAPPILLYQITSDWTYVLLGAEWYEPVDEVEDSPSMFGQTFHDPVAGHSPRMDQPRHRGLHAWLFRANPRGMFAPFNPRIYC